MQSPDPACPSPVVVDDAADERLADYRNLRAGTKPRRESRAESVIIEGHLALTRTLHGPLRLRSVLLTPARAESLAGLIGGLPPGVSTYIAERETLSAVAGYDVHRGVLASADRPSPADPNLLLARHRRVILLEGLTDLENVGAVFRVAAALGLGAVLLDARCADPLYRRCIRVSLGWSTVVPHARVQDLSEVMSRFSVTGHSGVALVPRSDAISVDSAACDGLLDDPVALLVGAEGAGLSDTTIEAADHRVSIPMAEEVDSLNAATALAVVSAFAAAQRGWDAR